MRNVLSKTIILFKIVGEVFFVYGLLGWIYGVLIQLYHPNWLAAPLSHLTHWIRVDTFTIASFLVSAIGFLMWRLAAELTRFPKDPK